MSSPGGLQQQQQQYSSQSDFFARWMPSSSRAGVILNPSSPVLAESLRHSAGWRSSPPPPRGPNAAMMGPDDSFASDFAPLPVSPGGRSSSCASVVSVQDDAPPAPSSQSSPERTVFKGGVVQPMPPSPRHSFGEVLAHQTEELPLRVKLEQLRQWQQHMQEQLKAHQLQELLRLQQDQQRLLGGDESQHCDISELSGSEGDESTVQAVSPCREAVFHSTADDQEQSFDDSSHYEDCDSTLASHHRDHDKHSHDRPIKPGIGGQTQTFEEMLEEQMRMEEQRLKSAQQQQSQNVAEAARRPPKRAFLKRGEGLSRFTKNNHKASLTKSTRETLTEPNPQLRDRVIPRRKSEPATTQKATGGTNSGAQRLPPVQRKTAVLNKENRPRGPCSLPQEVRTTNSKPVAPRTAAKVLGSHQRQNTEGTAPRKPGAHDGRRPPPNAVTKEMVAVTATAGGVSNKCQNGVGAREDTHGTRQRRTMSEGVQGEDHSFELALQEKLQRWDTARGMESMELGEFELLEEAAEELSFSSNSSFVMKVLQMDQKQRQLLAAKGLYQRRLSSTPIKSPRPSLTPPKALRRSNSLGSSSGGGGGTSRVNTSDSQANKRAADDDDEETDAKHGTGSSDASFCTNSEFGDQDVAVQPAPPPPTFPSDQICFQAPPLAPNLPYDKRSYQDRDGGSSRGAGLAAFSDATTEKGDRGDADSIVSNPDDSTLVEDKDDVFDDDDTWHDVEEEEEEGGGSLANDSRGPSPVSMPTTNGVVALKRKVAMNKGAGLDNGVVYGSAVGELDCVPPPPPSSSQLMTRLFPSLKPTAQTLPPRPQPAAEDAPGKLVQSRLRERLVELELEIERFKKENAALTRLRQDNEKLQENLRKDRAAFEQTKAEEMSKFEDYKKEESRRLQKERRVFERHATTARAMPDKKEREEIQALKQQLSSVQEELRRQESRWSSTQSRLRQQNDSLNSDNTALREEVRTLETLRLSVWKKSQSEGETDRRESVPAVTKGVKFAMDTRGSSSSPPHSSSTAATRGSLREPSLAATVKKSSMRRPSAPACLSSDLGRSVEARPASSRTTQDKPSDLGRSVEARPASSRTTQDKPSDLGRSVEARPASSRTTQDKPSDLGRSVDERPASSRTTQDKPSDLGRSVEARPASSRTTQDKPQSQEPINNNTTSPTLLCEMEQPTWFGQPESGQELNTHSDGKIETVLSCGGRLIVFPNGTRKELSADGQEAKVTFFNGDTKQVMADQRVIYYFAEAQTTHTTYPDGMEILQFSNNQTEKHFPDGHKEITFPDQTVKTLYPDGREESVLTDGTIIHVNPDGTKEIQFNTGQKEVHTAQYKRREYPDGTLKTVFTDGRQETRYPTGRLRIKDKDGNVVLDQMATDGHSPQQF